MKALIKIAEGIFRKRLLIEYLGIDATESTLINFRYDGSLNSFFEKLSDIDSTTQLVS